MIPERQEGIGKALTVNWPGRLRNCVMCLRTVDMPVQSCATL